MTHALRTPCRTRMAPHAARIAFASVLILGSAVVLPAPLRAQDDVNETADDAFGRRIGLESIGLYSESLVRGFDLQQAGNYRIGDVYFVRAAAPPDTIVEGSQIRVGPSALPIDFPAPSGVVQYRLRDAARDRASLELGFQHLLDSNPRPYLRSFFARRSDDGRRSLSGGALASPSARYIFGNEAHYKGVGLVPRMDIGDDWEATAFYSRYEQTYQADVGFQPAGEHALPRPERLRYLGQQWSRYDTRNTTYGAILATRPREDAWDFSLSGIHSRVVRPRSDYNLFTDIAADGTATGATVVARDREIFSRAYEGIARRDWTRAARRDELTLVARVRASDYRNPRVHAVDIGPVSLFEPIPQLQGPGDPGDGPRSSATIDQDEVGIGWQHLERGGLAINVGARRVRLDESSLSAGGVRAGRTSAEWLHNASAVLPLSVRLTAFASTTRGIEEAGTAPENAANRYEVLPPILARQAELGAKWQSTGGFSVIGTLFEIAKPEPGFDADNVYRSLNDVSHRGVELSLTGPVAEGLNLVAGASWLRPRLEGDLVDAGTIGERPVGRSSRVALAGFSYQPEAWGGFSIDADGTYYGAAPADDRNRSETSAYTVFNIGARYRFSLRDVPAQLRLRIYNATDKYAWTVDGSGIQSYEPERRVMLSMTLGE